jgi:hypothetical protein
MAENEPLASREHRGHRASAADPPQQAAPEAPVWARAAGAQQPDRVRRIGVLSGFAENDPEFQARMRAFQQGLEESGWSIGRNIQLDAWPTR